MLTTLERFKSYLPDGLEGSLAADAAARYVVAHDARKDFTLTVEKDDLGYNIRNVQVMNEAANSGILPELDKRPVDPWEDPTGPTMGDLARELPHGVCQAMVDAFYAVDYEPKLTKDHQNFPGDSVLGTVTGMWLAPSGEEAYADFEHIPPTIFEEIKHGRLQDISPSLFFGEPAGDFQVGLVTTDITLLGPEMPGTDGLSSLYRLVEKTDLSASRTKSEDSRKIAIRLSTTFTPLEAKEENLRMDEEKIKELEAQIAELQELLKKEKAKASEAEESNSELATRLESVEKQLEATNLAACQAQVTGSGLPAESVKQLNAILEKDPNRTLEGTKALLATFIPVLKQSKAASKGRPTGEALLSASSTTSGESSKESPEAIQALAKEKGIPYQKAFELACDNRGRGV